jgi:hypothetical protein
MSERKKLSEIGTLVTEECGCVVMSPEERRTFAIAAIYEWEGYKHRLQMKGGHMPSMEDFVESEGLGRTLSIEDFVKGDGL